MNGLKEFKIFLNKLDKSHFCILDKRENIKVSFLFNNPASLTDIADVEIRLGINLPESYSEFLKCYNGARIFDYEGLGGFKLLSTNEIQDVTTLVKNAYQEYWNDNIVIFAHCLGEENYLGFDVSKKDGEFPVVDCYCEDVPEDWAQITTNFDEFIKLLVKSQGDKFWLS